MTPPKLYKIGELIRYTGISRQTLHNYTMMGLIHEAERTESGHRFYDQDTFERIEKIKRYRLHRHLREVKKILDEQDARKAAGLPELEDHHESSGRPNPRP